LKTGTGVQIFKNSSIIKPVELELFTILSYYHQHGHHEPQTKFGIWGGNQSGAQKNFKNCNGGTIIV
jgi:hypothetical protein